MFDEEPEIEFVDVAVTAQRSSSSKFKLFTSEPQEIRLEAEEIKVNAPTKPIEFTVEEEIQLKEQFQSIIVDVEDIKREAAAFKDRRPDNVLHIKNNIVVKEWPSH